MRNEVTRVFWIAVIGYALVFFVYVFMNNPTMNSSDVSYVYLKPDQSEQSTKQNVNEGDGLIKYEKNELTFNCVDLPSSSLCDFSVVPERDVYGGRIRTLLVLIDKKTSSTKTVGEISGGSFYLSKSSDGKKVYYKIGRKVHLIDIDNLSIKGLEIYLMEGAGAVNNKKYYATNSAPNSGGGLEYCANGAEDSVTYGASAIKVLNVETGVIKTVLENKEKIFVNVSSNDTTKKVKYSELTPLNSKYSDGCPKYDYDHPIEGEIDIDF